MAKKKIEELTEPIKLTEAQYYKWRLTIEEMWHCEKKLEINNLKVKLLEKDAEIATAKSLLSKATNLRQAENIVKESKERYYNLKAKLEQLLGVSLNDKVIDEFTYEIKQAPAEG